MQLNQQNVVNFYHRRDFQLILLKKKCLFLFLVCLCSRLNTPFVHQMGQSLTYCKFLSVLCSSCVAELLGYSCVTIF